jgi:hypothetical protein
VSLTTIREGIATNLATIPGLRVAAEIPDNPNPPIAVVMPNTITYDEAFGRGASQYNFTVTVIVGRAADRIAQRKLNDYASPGAQSVKAAIESDRTLGGTAFDVRCESLSNIGAISLQGDTTYLAADFVVTAYAL